MCGFGGGGTSASAALGFRFDVETIILDGTAHVTTCRLLYPSLPSSATGVPADSLSPVKGEPVNQPNLRR
jgi:hypothetical protein